MYMFLKEIYNDASPDPSTDYIGSGSSLGCHSIIPTISSSRHTTISLSPQIIVWNRYPPNSIPPISTVSPTLAVVGRNALEFQDLVLFPLGPLYRIGYIPGPIARITPRTVRPEYTRGMTCEGL